MGEWNVYKTLFTSGALDGANITGALGVREQPRVGLKGTLPTSYLDQTRPAPQTHTEYSWPNLCPSAQPGLPGWVYVEGMGEPVAIFPLANA